MICKNLPTNSDGGENNSKAPLSLNHAHRLLWNESGIMQGRRRRSWRWWSWCCFQVSKVASTENLPHLLSDGFDFLIPPCLFVFSADGKGVVLVVLNPSLRVG